AFFICWRTSSCRTAWWSTFPFTCAQNLCKCFLLPFFSQHLKLFQNVTSVKSVALRGNEAGVGDDAAEFAFIGAIFYPGGEDHVFFDEDAADVVGSELQTDLADFDPWREPTGLDVVDVIEIQAADGESFQII